MTIQFTKYHALGNDYLVLHPTDTPDPLKPAQIRLICNRCLLIHEGKIAEDGPPWIWCLVFGVAIGVKPVRFRKVVLFLPFEGAAVRSYPVASAVA